MDSKTDIVLEPHQLKAVKELHDGAVLYGKTGSGKTYTALQYYKENWQDNPSQQGQPLIVITTAKVRNTGSWVKSAENLGVKDITVDSWNNIEKYKNSHAFFIFDEQKTLGYGKWSRLFIHIARRNNWILLSATVGDEWKDYRAIMIANGYYKNKGDFDNQHIVYNPYVNFPQILKYINTIRLTGIARKILVPMPDKRTTTRHDHYIQTDYNEVEYKKTQKDRFNYEEKRPIRNTSEYTQTLRRIVSSSNDRIARTMDLVRKLDRVIIFYNYNFEKDILIRELEENNIPTFQYNGKKHDELPEGDRWAYVVQYNAVEGWDAITTNNIIFYSPNYSYKVIEQAKGRIDRLNNTYQDLHYYFLGSPASIDIAVFKAIAGKRKFNESTWKEAVNAYGQGATTAISDNPPLT